jgi:hypothetical protein
MRTIKTAGAVTRKSGSRKNAGSNLSGLLSYCTKIFVAYETTNTAEMFRPETEN